MTSLNHMLPGCLSTPRSHLTQRRGLAVFLLQVVSYRSIQNTTFSSTVLLHCFYVSRAKEIKCSSCTFE